MMNLNVAKKVVSLVLVLGIILISGIVLATDTGRVDPPMRWSYLYQCGNDFGLSDDYYGTAYLTIFTETYDGYRAQVSGQLQKKSGTKWSNVSGVTWNDSSTDEFACVDEDPIYLNAGTYRVKVTHRARNSSGTVLETFVTYTDEVTL